MPATRDAIALTPDEVDAFLRAGRILVLVTLGPDGLPDPVPMWYVVEADGTVVMRTFAKSQKAVNLRRDPRFAALVEDGARYAELRGVQLTGVAELVADPERIADVVAGLAAKYEGVAEEHLPGVRAAALEQARKQVAIRLRVERVASWDHRKQAT